MTNATVAGKKFKIYLQAKAVINECTTPEIQADAMSVSPNGDLIFTREQVVVACFAQGIWEHVIKEEA